ncbi:MAG: family 20 glycosylhydrolase [Bifidobacterium longum]|nr:family 20 glycosylhydrolase [Bifidobacterium longum]
MEYTHGTALIGPLVTIEDADQSWETLPIEQLSDELRRRHGVTVLRRRTHGTVISLGLDSRLAHDEYTLDVSESEGIRVRGGGESGLRYGLQTLRQIIGQTSRAIPCLHIQDKPAFPVRAYSLDVTRGRVPTMEFLTWFVDQLALYKYNQFQLYVEHAFAFVELSEAWRGTDPLTADDITYLDEYCARRGIELVPSLATFGHMYMNLRTREHRGLGEFPEDADRPFSFIERMEHHTLNAADPKAHDFASRLIEEYAPLFRSKSFNIGGDETFDLGRGRSAQDAPGVGRDELYAGFVRDLCETLARHGRQPMLWADIALESPRTMDLLPGDITMLNWMYEPQIDESKIQTIAAQGRRQFVCPAVRAWSRFFPDYAGAWLNTYHMASGTGALNMDVAACMERSSGGRLTLDRTLGCDDARRRMLQWNRERIERRRDCDQVLLDCGDVFAGLDKGGLTAEFLSVMLDGQRLFNELGEELLALADGKDVGSGANRLAADLELWFERYRAQWLSVGRHAELARIAHVVWSLADILRRGAL